MSFVAYAQLLQSCLTLCDPMDSSPLGSSVLRISQARVLEWVTISSSRGSCQPRDQTCVSRFLSEKHLNTLKKKKVSKATAFPLTSSSLVLKFSPSLTFKTPRPVSSPTSLPVIFSFTSPASKYPCSSKHNSSGLFPLTHVFCYLNIID